jgi:hypothetical protein
MLINALKTIFNKDLNRLRNEIDLFKNEDALWAVEKNIANSSGNLCLHLIGNLNTYIGKEIGGIDYLRNRDLEFSLKNIPKSELVDKVDDTIRRVNTTLDKLTADELANDYPIIVFEEKMSTEYFLMHLSGHLTYHLGQINYHRRLLDTLVMEN